MAEEIKRTVKKNSDSAETTKTVKKAAKKVDKPADLPVEKKVKEAAPEGNATGLRIGAVICWVLAIACEVVAILILGGQINLKFCPQLYQMIGALVIDLIFVIIGSQLWKKANHIDPVSKENKVKFWLWNNMGVIVAAFAFAPFIILALTDKKADKKTKTIAAIAAAVALAIGGLASFDWNPISSEEKAAAENQITDDVYWTPFGHVYHLDMECGALANSETLTKGTVDEAMSANRTRLCKFCAKNHGIEDVPVDGAAE